MECQCLLTERNNVFYKFGNELSVQNPVDIFNLVDNKNYWDTWYITGYEWCIT
jgi:hypothetical protein